MASAYFGAGSATAVDAMAKCCQNVFGRLTQTASWGLAALQALTLSEKDFENLALADQRRLRNLPARVYYGVNSDEAVAMRLIGLPRVAAAPMAAELSVTADEPLSQLRVRVRESEAAVWDRALGRELGQTYRRVWSILESGD
jgi:hypothetical protein